MGGDFAPDAAIAGALHAILELGPEHTLQLVGPSEVVRDRVSALATGELAGAAAHSGRLEVIEAQRSVLQIDRGRAELAAARYSTTVRLIRALGGGWN